MTFHSFSYAAISVGFLATSAVADTVGARLSTLDMPHHGAAADVSVWYPSGGGGEIERFGDNPVFNGVDAAFSADVAEGTYPLVVYSHGMGGDLRPQAWFAAGLAERGAIVLTVNHINSTWGRLDMSKGVDHWTRNADLTTAMDALLADPDFAGRIDMSRIMAAGFSFGGWTALSMGGMTGNHAGIVAACEAYGSDMEACDMLLSPRVNLPAKDPAIWNADYSDPRVTHVMAIDPGFVWGHEAANVEGLVANATMIALGGPDTQMLATNFDKSGLSALAPTVQTLRIDPAFHFTMMPVGW